MATRLVQIHMKAADDEAVGAVRGLGVRPEALELIERTRESPGRQLRDVMVPGNHEQGRPERPEKGGGTLVFGRAVPVREVTAHDDELGGGGIDERLQIALDLGLFLRPCMEIRHLQDA